MKLGNIDLTIFLQFPGILITIGIFFLLISIVITIIIYITENKQQNIKATDLSPNYDYGYYPNAEVNYPDVPYNNSDDVSPVMPNLAASNDVKPLDNPNETDSMRIDAFENEFSNYNEDNSSKNNVVNGFDTNTNISVEDNINTDSDDEIELL